MIDRNNMQRVINIAGAANAASKAARAGLLALMLAGFSLPVVAQTVEIAPETVVATVDGAEIKQADVEFVMQDLAEDLARVPENERRQVAIDILIEMSLLSSAAKAEGLDDTSPVGGSVGISDGESDIVAVGEGESSHEIVVMHGMRIL